MKGVSCHIFQGCHWDRDRGDRPWTSVGLWEPAWTPFQRRGGDRAKAGTGEQQVQTGRQWARTLGCWAGREGRECRCGSGRKRVCAAGPGTAVSQVTRWRHTPATSRRAGRETWALFCSSGSSPVRGQPRRSGGPLKAAVGSSHPSLLDELPALSLVGPGHQAGP